MANLFDYLASRGGQSLQEASLNDVDALVLARLSNLPFDRIVPEDLQNTITLAEASRLFFQSEEAIEKAFFRADLRFLEKASSCTRFSQMDLCGYTNQIDVQAEKQFAAMVIRISPALSFVSFRGTDLTLTGWKEDFNMSFCTPIPAQQEAVRYLNWVAQGLTGELIVGGHSKGGNLSVYASAFCEPQVQRRIKVIYNLDGPGFDASVLASDGYARISTRVKTFIPQSSIVGMLLQHEEDYYVVHSRQIGLMQHDLFSWEVDEDQLVYVDEVTGRSKFIDSTLKTWLASLSLEEREKFVDTLFAILEETNATTLKELTANWHKNAGLVLRSVRELDDEMRHNISHSLSLLFKAVRQNAQLNVPRPRLLLRTSQTEDDKKP
ncbi:MAG: DUF2974 domain-containing protein [Firmicutes bacterium]|nr:DUF2974 domain-containing protein [Bacillota bacterium]